MKNVVEVAKELERKKGYLVAGEFLKNLGEYNESAKLYERIALNLKKREDLFGTADILQLAATSYSDAGEKNKTRTLCEKADVLRKMGRDKVKISILEVTDSLSLVEKILQKIL